MGRQKRANKQVYKKLEHRKNKVGMKDNINELGYLYNFKYTICPKTVLADRLVPKASSGTAFH